MFPLLRGSLVVAGLAGAFAAGYFLKPAPAISRAAEPPGKPVSAWTPHPTPPAPGPATTIQVLEIRVPDGTPAVKPATVLAPPEKIDPNDPAFRMIRDSLGIKTTVLDKSEPLPPVLTDALKDPAPMGGPMPRLEPPPAPVAPMIDEAPTRRPDSSPRGMIRISIRDHTGNVTTITTSDLVTIELISPDGQRPAGPERGPMPHAAGDPISGAPPAITNPGIR
jgi:hypothetical protein